jgi:receptor protein-tyrosine kinase
MEQTEKTLPKLDIMTLVLDYVSILRRLILVGILLAAVCAAGNTFLKWRSYTPMYEAHISFTVRLTNPLYANVTGYNAQAAEQMEKTFPYILSSNALRESVTRKLGVSYLPAVGADVVAGTNVFTLWVRSSNPEEAHRVLMTLVECYPDVSQFVLGPTEMIVLDETGIPTSPYNPFVPMDVATKGATIGIMLWLALALLLTITKKTVRSEEELQNLLNCPCLGALPTTKVVGRNYTIPLAFYDHGKHGFMEATHLLALHLERELKEKAKKILLVSSACPNEGKTTVAANIAVSLAQNGNRVLLVDCDLRNPSAAVALRSSNSKGLSNLLDGTITVKDLVRPTNFQGVHFVPGGEGQKYTPADLLSNAQFKALIAASRKVFDYVILDTAPCGLVSDASEIAELADCALIVVRQDHASRNQVLEAIRSLTESKLPLLGSVLNGARGYSSYGYGYGYGYGKK